MKKLTTTLIVLIAIVLQASAQKIDIKGDEVMLDGKQILKYKKINVIQHSFYSLGGDEVLFCRFDDNGTNGYTKDDYLILNFLTLKKKVLTSDYSRISALASTRKMMEKLVRWLVEDKVINANGELDPDKVDTFVAKYHQENLTN